MQKPLNEDFIEEYSEQFATTICDKFFAEKTHITGQEILNITPSKQVNLFVIKLLFNNWQDESKRLESPFFDYSSNNVKEAMAQFMNVLSRFIKVGRKEFEILLQDALRDTLFFIMSPNVYIEIEMDRKGTETLTEKSAKNIIKYLRIAKEEFGSNIIGQVGKDRDDLVLDETILTDEMIQHEISLLSKIMPLSLKKLEEGDEEEDSILEHSQEEESEVGDSPEVESISQEVVEADSDVSEPVEESENEEVLDGSQGQVFDALVNKDIVEADPVADENKTENEGNEESIEPIEESHDPIDDFEGTEETEKIETTPQINPEIITNLDPDEEDEDDEDAILNSRFEDPMVGSIAEKHEADTDTMLSAISLNHRYMFINELFDGEADLFAEAINRVDGSNSFDDSVEMLMQNYAKDFHWDMNSDEVKELLKIIFRRFR